MATKKNELAEQETKILEDTNTAGESISESENPAKVTGTPLEDAVDSMDLNERLGSMDTDPEDDFQEESEDGNFAAELLVDLDEDVGDMRFPESAGDAENSPEPEAPLQEETPAKPKRSTRRKKAEAVTNSETSPGEEMEQLENAAPVDISPSSDELTPVDAETEAEDGKELLSVPESESVPEESPASASRRPVRTRQPEAPVLTIESRGEVETQAEREDAIWHEIHNAYRTRKILTGQLGGIEQMDNGKSIVIVDYKGFRIIIPLKEMMINLGRSPSGQEYAEFMQRQNKILGNMLGAEIDFIVRGIDSKTRSVVASRREAMLKKRQIFYLDTDGAGMYRIYEGRIVQARVIAVAEKVIRVEVFGVECSIMARDLAWDWIGDAHERFSVGDQVLVRILGVRRDSLKDIGIRADIKSVSQNTNHDNLKKCRIQSKYAGKVTDIHKGVVYIRLSNGVNAVAHSCFDYRTPGKKDDVSFAVTRLDEERGVAVGIITRIIRQNL